MSQVFIITNFVILANVGIKMFVCIPNSLYCYSFQDEYSDVNLLGCNSCVGTRCTAVHFFSWVILSFSDASIVVVFNVCRLSFLFTFCETQCFHPFCILV